MFFSICFFQLATTSWKSGKVSAAGVGVLMSTLVPKQNATLATAVVLLVMGGAISEPQVIADATGVAWLLDGVGVVMATAFGWLFSPVVCGSWNWYWKLAGFCHEPRSVAAHVPKS